MAIKWLEVLNLPHDQSNWKIWDKIDVWWKNLLLIWDNGTGKTTMLQLIDSSLQRYQDVLSGENQQKWNPYKAFTDMLEDSFDYADYCVVGSIMEHKEPEEVDEIYEEFEEICVTWFNRAINAVYKLWSTHVFDKNYRASKEQLSKTISIYIYETVNSPKYNRDNSAWIFENACEQFCTSAEKFAKKYKIKPEVVYGNFVLMIQEAHGLLANDIVLWWHLKVIWTTAALTRKRIILNESQKDADMSLGEYTKSIFKDIHSRALYLLDEPTNWLDRKSKETTRETMFQEELRGRIFAASHDEILIEQAIQNPDSWYVHDLWKKTKTQKTDEY